MDKIQHFHMVFIAIVCCDWDLCDLKSFIVFESKQEKNWFWIWFECLISTWAHLTSHLYSTICFVIHSFCISKYFGFGCCGTHLIYAHNAKVLCKLCVRSGLNRMDCTTFYPWFSLFSCYQTSESGCAGLRMFYFID